MKVLLVDDHPLILSALEAVIKTVGSKTIVVGPNIESRPSSAASRSRLGAALFSAATPARRWPAASRGAPRDKACPPAACHQVAACRPSPARVR